MMAWQRLFQPALWLSALLVLGGCGGSSTDIVEREPEEDPAGEEHDHEHDEDPEDEHLHGDAPDTAGRLAVAAAGGEAVLIYDLDDGEEQAHYDLGAQASALYASADPRFALILQRSADRVNAVDSGLIREQHGDHWDYTMASPGFMDFEATGLRPTHYTRGDNRSVVFYDGNADTGEAARVGVFTEADLADNGAGRWLELDTHQHGAARHFDGSLFTTLRDPADSDSSLPDRVARYHWHDTEYEQEQVFDVACPDLHGSTGWDHGVAFGCRDGVLVIHAEEGDFTAEKIANPEGLDGRIGSLYASPSAELLVGVDSGELYVIDPEADRIEAIDWRGEQTREAVAYGFDAEGAHFLVLDEGGDLTRLEVADDWQRLEPIDVVSSDLSGLGEDRRPVMSVSHAGHWAYVTDPVADTVVAVDLESGEVETVLNLEVTPAAMTWLGFEGAHDHAH